MPSNRGMSSAMVPVLPEARRWAAGLGWYFNFRMASCTRRAFSSETVFTPLMTRDTVVVETPAVLATWVMSIFPMAPLCVAASLVAPGEQRPAVRSRPVRPDAPGGLRRDQGYER